MLRTDVVQCSRHDSHAQRKLVMRSARWASIGRNKENGLVPIIAGIFAPNDLKTEMAAIENKAYCNAHSDFFRRG